MKQHTIAELYSNHIKGTEKGAVVRNVHSLLCTLTQAVQDGVGVSTSRVYINTRVLKHVYDKRPAEEFDFLVKHLHTIVKYPLRIYINKVEKKGDLCFVAEQKQATYFCSLEIITGVENTYTHYEIVTFFKLQKEQYLEHYELLWEWKGGEPSS